MMRGFLLLAALLSISNSRETVEKSERKTLFSIFRDERGILEPQTELLSVALAVVGFMVFAALLSQTYFGYEDRSFALENYKSATLLAETLSDASALKAENPNILSAVALDNLSASQGSRAREKFFAAFSGNYLFLIKVRTGDGRWQWQIVPDNVEPDSFSENKEKIAASVPVVIELNPAESVPGTLTVVLYKTVWK
jgi:hypothetical protein